MIHLVLAGWLSLAVAQQVPPGPAAVGELAGYEDNREPAGRLEEGTFWVSLEARAAGWRPWGDDGPMVGAHVFAVEGARAKVPGPLLRVTAGTPVHVTIRNSLGDTLLVRGLLDRGRELPPGVSPGPALVTLPFVGDSLVVAPGETAEVQFTPTVPGDYFYFGRTMEPGWSSTPGPVPLGGWPEAVSFYGENAQDRALVGVLIVDAPGEVPDPEERIFLISHWADRDDPGTWVPSARFLINGRAWPHTERLAYRQGDTVRWRVINQSGGFHPMHLHGFYFHVDAWTGQDGRSPLAPGERPLVVTWGLPPTTAMRLSWVADEPGNWIFHCHLMRHMSWMQHPVSGGDAAHGHGTGEGVDLMGGLVLGITIEPDEGWTPAVVSARRQLRLHIGQRDRVFGDEPGYGFVLQEGPDPPAPDSVRFPGSPIVLNRGEPAEIVVHNHADVPLGVHWHGLELESWADGVPGWSGMPGSLVPAISPGDSLVVRMTPPRAGTFMYHVHSEPGHQLAQGLYGPFLVLEPGESWDPETDRLFLLASLGVGENPPPALNGQVAPGPMDFVAGSTYRLRFMHISPDDNKSIQLRAGNEPAVWRFVARDGADLPPVRVEARPADVPLFDVGSTFDVLWTPEAPGDMTIRIVTRFDAGLTVFPGAGTPPHTMDIPVRVRSANVAIRGATVVDVAGGMLVPDQTVLIAGNRIVAVGPTDEVGIAPGADVIDAEGGYLIPGLWDMHVHSVRSPAAVGEEGSIDNVEWHFPLFLAYGVTGVRNMNDATADPTLQLTNSVKRRLAEGELLGPRLLAPGSFVDGDPPLGEGAVVVRTEAEARAVVDRLADAGADFIKPYENLSREAYFAIMDQARRRGIPVDGHLPFRVTAEEAAAAGQRTVEHPEVMALGCSTNADALRDRFARLLSDDYDSLPEDEQFLVQFRLYRAFYDTRDPAACEPTLEALRRNGVAVTMDLVALHHIVHADEILADTTSMRLVPHSVRQDWEERAAGETFRAFQSILRPIIPLELENARLLHEAGVTLLAATDVGVPLQVPGISLHRELVRLTEAGLTPLEALRAATLNPARVLGLADSLGTIEAGKLADLVLLDANPLVDIRNTQRIRAVMADGRLYRRADLDRLLAEENSR
jgi:manganese oxidase